MELSFRSEMTPTRRFQKLFGYNSCRKLKVKIRKQRKENEEVSDHTS